MGKQKTVDILGGSLWKNIARLAFPLMVSGILQCLYNAADIVVVGRYAGELAVAAVGSNGALINLILNLFMGISAGVSVCVSQRLGARDHEGVTKSVHSTVALALTGGVGLGILGLLLARPLLYLVGSPAEILDSATLYLKIYFLGAPALLMVNFGSALLRSGGDTKRPLYFMTLSGLINVGLNLIFVMRFHMGVAGVAWATTISQYVSAILIFGALMRREDSLRLFPSRIRFHGRETGHIVVTGVPAGIQGMLFSLSNLTIQSSINSFGAIAVAGNAAGTNIEAFIYTAMNAFYQVAMTFVGQYVGAKKWDQIPKILGISVLYVSLVGLLLSWSVLFSSRILLHIYLPDSPEAIEAGMLRMRYFMPVYFFCGIMDVLCGVIRGMGSIVTPMMVSLLGACGFRILWVFTVFARFRSMEVLLLSYAVSWFLTALAHLICYTVIKRRKMARDMTEIETQ